MRSRVFAVLFIALSLAACSNNPSPTQIRATSSAQSAATLTAEPSSTPAPPTPTPEPLALKVNGEGVSLAEYQAQVKQIQAAEPNGDAAAQRKRVMQELVNETLLAQAAFKGGFSLDETALQAKIDALAKQAGSEAALTDWQTRMGYTPASLRTALRRSVAAAWEREKIFASVPTSAEQVHARQILVQSEALANQVETQARQAGTNFATLAFGYDRVTGGDLSWFPKGYLNEQAVEDAAFALQPGQISDVIKSSIGYHIIQVIARETRPLSQSALLATQKKALSAWLENAARQSQVEELAP